MRLIKPPWLTHGGEKVDFEVYSCHVSPDGKRLATAAGDGHARIWSTEAIYNATKPEYTGPKQLAALSYHSGTIHTVRFSGNNKYLASGADDKIVCVYTLDPNPPSHASTFGSNEPPPVENWRIFRRLIGHDNDVQDLGWSYDSSILVSVGLDSKVVVWSGHTFERLKTISAHTSHVKGITFDPANKYFATASDDRTISVFRFTSPAPNSTASDHASNFVLEASIAMPFINSPLTTYFRRCSWSPDGNHIAAANAVNGPVSSVAIINRGTWDSDINLIGHEGPVEVCAFSPRLFCREPISEASDFRGNSEQPRVTVIACAGQDKALTVWVTSQPRPLVIAQDVGAKTLSDLAWTPDGEILFITSLDGSILAAVFDHGELGYPAPLLENERSLTKYGAGRKTGIVEGPEGVILEERSKEDELRGVQGRMGELMGDGHVGGPPLNGNTDAAASNAGALLPNGANALVNGQTNGQSTQPTPQQANDPNGERAEKLKQRVTVTKDGKKRIAPLLVSSDAQSSLPRPQLISQGPQDVRNGVPQTVLDLSKPFDGLPKGGLTALLFGNKRSFAEIEADEDHRPEKRLAAMSRDGATPILVNGENGLEIPDASKRNMLTVPLPSILRPAIVTPALTVSQMRLAVPVVRSIVVRPAGGTPPISVDGAEATFNDNTAVLEARNASGASRTGRPQDRDPTRVSVTRRGQTLWQDYLPRAVLLTTGNANFWAAGCEDGSLYVWTPAGRRLFNPIIMDAQPVILDTRGWWLLCITAVGLCHVWNVKSQLSPHPPISLAPVLDMASISQGPHLTPSPSLIFARLNSRGRIIVAMSNGDGYAYSPDMYAWQRLSEPWWAVGSQYWNTMDASVGSIQSASGQGKVDEEDDVVNPENISAGIIPLLERNTTSQTLLRGRAYYLHRLIKSLITAEGFEGFEASVSIAHLENRVAAAMALGAREEFRIYLNAYAKRLGSEGLRGKVEELLRSLLGKIFEDPNENGRRRIDQGNGWFTDQEELCGWKRLDLLKEVVLILGKHRDLQRITVPYANLLGITGRELGHQDMTNGV